MKVLSWKTGVIVSFALCFVVSGMGIVACQKPAAVQPQPKRYPHEHLQTSALEPNAQLHAVDYKLGNGETLANIARLRYGHQNYYRVIKLYNNLEDERQLAADYALRLPDMSVILADEGLTKVAASEMALILCSRAKYDKVVKQLWTLRTDSTNNYQLPADVRQELLEAVDDLQQATESLKQPKPGVTAPPTHLSANWSRTCSAYAPWLMANIPTQTATTSIWSNSITRSPSHTQSSGPKKGSSN